MNSRRSTNILETPFVVIDQDRVVENFRRIKSTINEGKVEIFYSVKANNHPKILEILNSEGSGFDVASLGEIRLLEELNVDPKKITFSAPTKIPKDILEAYRYGIRLFAFDSESELEKLACLAPKSKVFLRIIVPNIGSEWPLVRKFGAPVEKALKLFKFALQLNLIPYGIAFHVGSQCHNENTWARAIKKSAKVWKQLKNHGINLQLLNLGGGFPVHYTREVPSIEKISKIINLSLKKYFGRTKPIIIVEPGRFIVGDAGVLVTSVINKVKRGRENWLYLDTGVYNGLQEVLEGWKYKVISARKKGAKKKFILAGPSCDSTDIIGNAVLLPDLNIGDRLFFLSAGAYTTSYETYNGIGYPKTHFVGKNLGKFEDYALLKAFKPIKLEKSVNL